MTLMIKRRTRKPAGKERAKRALSSTSGFTLTEALATVVIVGLVTCILASGIALASRQYTQSMVASESQMLYSSLQQVLDTELRYTSKVYCTGDSVDGFVSKHYISKDGAETNLLATVDDDGNVQPVGTPGELVLSKSLSADETAVNRLLGTGAYNYGLKASIPSITYDQSSKYFTVNLVISRGTGSNEQVCAKGEFSVKAMNIRPDE